MNSYMTLVVRLLFTACLLAAGGCTGANGAHALVSAVEVKRTEVLQISQEVVTQHALDADLPAQAIAGLGVEARAYAQAEIAGLMQALSDGHERAFLDLSRAVRRAYDEKRRGTSLPGDLRQLFGDEIASLLQSVASEAGYAELQADLAAIAENPDENARVAALQRVAMRLEKLEPAVRQRVTAKTGLRRWLEHELALHPFTPAINVVIDVAHGSDSPLVVSDVALVSVTRERFRPFTQRERTCNAQLSACRFVFNYSLNKDDEAEFKRLAAKSPSEAGESHGNAFGERMREYLDRSTITFSVFVNGGVLSAKTPGKYVRLHYSD